MALLLIIAFLFALYSILILYYLQAWKDIPFYTPSERTPHTRVSVIIPARNEEENIGPLLQALEQQTYPRALTEVIVVDDHSTDGTASEVRKFPWVNLIQLSADGINSYKKKAIETGIHAAGGEWIVTTDADCLPPPRWLETMVAVKEEKKAVFIAAPVRMEYNKSWLQRFQSLDFLVLQGITGAAVNGQQLSMCNGANLGYSKAAFTQVNGFSGIDRLASGDDMLLMHKIRREFPDKIFYLKSPDAIVSTAPMKTWRAFFNQRIRWASKSGSYREGRLKAILLLVYLFNCSFAALAIAGFFHWQYWIWLGVLWIAKTALEWPFVSIIADFFRQRSLLSYFFLFQPLHILYTLSAGFLGLFGKYEWKGRKVR